MAKEMYQHEVAVVVLSPFGFWYLMMHMQFFIVEERVFADQAYPILLLGDFLSTGWEVCDFPRISLAPVFFQRRVVW